MSLQVELLEQSFSKVAPQADEFVMTFYDNLFTDYPAAKPLFEHSDMKQQGQMLKGGLVMVIENLRNPDVLTKALGGLGARHVKYGALPEHYPLVGNSLLKTFEHYLKEDWTEETKAAWVEANGAITALMLEGADYSSEAVELSNTPPAEAPEEEAGLNVTLLEESFGKVAPKADDFVMSFYDNLFTDYPAAKPLFEHTNMKSQGQMLKGGLVMVVENLRNPDVLSKALGGLGARHVKYGALPEHYPLVGNSLLKTFEQYLEADWTEETKQAWVDAYGAITALMLEGADYSSEDVDLDNAPAAAEIPEEEAGLKVSLLEESFGKVAPQADEFVMSFYDNLFTDYPAAKPLFEHTNMKSQGQMLKGGLVMVVENLRKPEVLSKALGGLGARHVKYGALPEHYPLVGNSLLKTFEQYLKADWTPEVKNAWVEAYGAITALMLEGADYSQQDVQLESAPEPSLPKLTDPSPQATSAEGSGGASAPSEVSPEGDEGGIPVLPVAGGILGLGVLLLVVILL